MLEAKARDFENLLDRLCFCDRGVALVAMTEVPAIGGNVVLSTRII